MNKEITRLGKGSKKTDNWIKATLNLSVLNPEFWREYEGHKYLPININIGEPDKYGKDVQITLDTYNPNQRNETMEKKRDAWQPTDLLGEKTLPF